MKFKLFVVIAFLFSIKINGQTIKKRFPDKHKFPTYKTSIYKGQLAKPIIKKDSIGRFSKKQIINTYYKDGVNFGGHYCFIVLGCGNTCYDCILIDVKTGIAYEGVGACMFYEFRKDSRMLITNIPELDSNGYYDEDCCYPCKKEVFGDVYVWSESSKLFIKLKTK